MKILMFVPVVFLLLVSTFAKADYAVLDFESNIFSTHGPHPYPDFTPTYVQGDKSVGAISNDVDIVELSNGNHAFRANPTYVADNLLYTPNIAINGFGWNGFAESGGAFQRHIESIPYFRVVSIDFLMTNEDQTFYVLARDFSSNFNIYTKTFTVSASSKENEFQTISFLDIANVRDFFINTNNSLAPIVIDNVAIESPVPEPSSYALMLLGLLCLLNFARPNRQI